MKCLKTVNVASWALQKARKGADEKINLQMIIENLYSEQC